MSFQASTTLYKEAFLQSAQGNTVQREPWCIYHVKSNKHDEGKRKGKSNEPREADTALAPEKHDSDTHHKGETLPEAQRVEKEQIIPTPRDSLNY